MDNRNTLMRRIQERAFAKDETALYLNTHPECQAALGYFREVLEMLDGAMSEYQNKYGPIYAESGAHETWTWAEGAWPWQNEKYNGGEKD